jgi:hypothetical protein
MRWVSCKQQIVGSSFLIQFARQCLLIGELSPLTFSVYIVRCVVIPVIWLFLCKGLIVCSWINVTLWLLVFSSPVIWYCLSFHGLVCFHFLCVEFLEESFVVVAWWAYITLVSAYLGRLLLLHLFWMIVLLGRVSKGWGYFHSVPRIPHSMPFLLLRFQLRNLLWFWWAYLCMLSVFSFI